jgi:hypothetical protein
LYHHLSVLSSYKGENIQQSITTLTYTLIIQPAAGGGRMGTIANTTMIVLAVGVYVFGFWHSSHDIVIAGYQLPFPLILSLLLTFCNGYLANLWFRMLNIISTISNSIADKYYNMPLPMLEPLLDSTCQRAKVICNANSKDESDYIFDETFGIISRDIVEGWQRVTKEIYRRKKNPGELPPVRCLIDK